MSCAVGGKKKTGEGTRRGKVKTTNAGVLWGMRAAWKSAAEAARGEEKEKPAEKRYHPT